MLYCWDGVEIEEDRALFLLRRAAMLKGWSLDNVMELWAERGNEEGRDFIFETSGMHLEIWDSEDYEIWDSED